jgi:hypothetical protein
VLTLFEGFSVEKMEGGGRWAGACSPVHQRSKGQVVVSVRRRNGVEHCVLVGAERSVQSMSGPSNDTRSAQGCRSRPMITIDEGRVLHDERDEEEAESGNACNAVEWPPRPVAFSRLPRFILPLLDRPRGSDRIATPLLARCSPLRR